MPKNITRRNILKGGITIPFGLSAGENASCAVDENPFPPKKIIKKTPYRYSPLSYLEKVGVENKPQLAFSAQNLTEARAWQKNLRMKLWELLGEQHAPGATIPSAKLLEIRKSDSHTQEKWELDVVPERSMPFYILKPLKGEKPYRTVLCLHGHGNGARDIINMPVDEEARELIRVLNTDYALQCVKRGWCSVAPELFAFGERVDFVEDARPGFDGGCEKPSLNAVHLGKTLIGIRTKDICTLIDWLSSTGEFELANLPCVGLSGGGMMTMYTAALDERIKRALISGYVTEAKDSILGIRHCSCNYVPRLAEWADFPDIAGLIAPRFLIVQSGKRDAIFPIDSVRRAFTKIERVYDIFNSKDNLHLHEHDGYHSFWSPSLDALLV